MASPLAFVCANVGRREYTRGRQQGDRVAELGPRDQRDARPEHDLEGEHALILADVRGGRGRGRLAP
jgi:hypothetical protein